MLAKLLNTNCFVDFKSGEERRNNSLTMSKKVFYKNRNRNKNRKKWHRRSAVL